MSNQIIEKEVAVKFDSSLLQFIPKGSFYNSQDEQMTAIDKVWNDFLSWDRQIFALSTLLPGTEYSKGRMFHKLLSTNSNDNNDKIIVNGLPIDYEKRIINFGLRNGDLVKSIKNLLMFLGIHQEEVTTRIKSGKQIFIKKKTQNFYLDRINNARSRNIIMEFLFNRSLNSLEEISIKFKRKCQKLIRHALGIQALNSILNGNEKLYKKYILKYNKEAKPILYFIFNKELSQKDLEKLPKISMYLKLKQAAKNNNIKEFQEIVNSKMLPFEVLMGFRNTYKVPIDLKEIFEKGRMSEKQAMQSETATKRAGGEKRVINYENQDLYSLWKMLYHKIKIQDKDIAEIISAINEKSKNKIGLGFDFGKLVVIFDASKSMEGGEQRPLHPLLSGLSLISVLENIEEIIYVGGKKINTGINELPSIIIPSGNTELWKALIQAVEKNPDTIIVISDGYENTIQGMFELVYNRLKDEGKKFQLLHINPVFASEVSGVRRLIKNIKPLMAENHQYLKTNLIFEMLQERREEVKKLLISEFNKLLLTEKK